MRRLAVALCLLAMGTLQASTCLEELVTNAKALVANNCDKGCESLLTLLDTLAEQGCVLETGSDDLRAKYVACQGLIEQTLANALEKGELVSLIGIIHTPQPATPLCTEVDPLDLQLLDPSLHNDPERLSTVRMRAAVLRDYLNKGGLLYIAYPREGFAKRSLTQQEVYKKLLGQYPGNLFDRPLNRTTMDPDKVGATYFFKTKQGERFAFSIKARQANDLVLKGEWALWLGEISQPVIQLRTLEIVDYLNHPFEMNFGI